MSDYQPLLAVWGNLLIRFFFPLPFRESDITKERIQKILSAGATVVLTTGGIDDMCLKYFVDAGAMAVRRVLKKDLKRIAKATGGRSHPFRMTFCTFFVLKNLNIKLDI